MVLICNFGRLGLKVLASAKINLGLKVVGKREDGFHDLVSVFQEVDLYDEISLKATDDGTLEVVCPSSGVPGGSENLAHRAAAALRHAARRPDLGARISIQKRIPTGGGLGGGSSDAARVLIALNEIWNLGKASLELAEIGAGIGSDVPFFAKGGGTALVTGRGEHVQDIDFSGDIAITESYVVKNGKYSTQSFFMLMVHGMLHLFKYSHYDRNNRETMRMLENICMTNAV